MKQRAGCDCAKQNCGAKWGLIVKLYGNMEWRWDLPWSCMPQYGMYYNCGVIQEKQAGDVILYAYNYVNINVLQN